ncbi:cytochrome C biogenesis protein [Sorangium cellulosum]|uniref:Cytochrome c-type biogenesis protein n=1 Tax=Sorangium cellulosum TaxID=56 RepID=A0A150RUM7_SORCE|nr:cytochrome C biogenesis protein [Sorangium cellulosum]
MRVRSTRSSRWRRAAALAAAVAGMALSISSRAEPATPSEAAAELVDSTPAPGERALAARLLAPCCWDQTLDVHESEVARDLRREIRARLRRGEAADVIEQDLVARYGDRLRAAPSSGVLGKVALGLMLGIAVAFLGIFALLRSWRRSDAQPAPSSVALPAAARDEYDERLDDELRGSDA